MKKTLMAACAGMLAAGMAGAEMAPLPTVGAGWGGNPITWRFREDGVHCTVSNGHGIAVYEAAPLAANVTVEAVFTPQKAAGNGWNIASVAIVNDERNYWHLALVQTPPEQGCRPFVELCEMRNGEWLAQGNLKQEINESPSVPWTFGAPHRLTLSMDDAGITGTILAPDGRLILRRRFAFSAPAVTQGRPALRIGGITGVFSGVRAEWAKPVAEQVAAPDIPAYEMANVVPGITDTATGFFRVVQKPDGRWWAIDPLGRGVVLLGIDHVTFRGHWCEKLGYAPHGRKNEKKYADHAEWETETLGRLKQWGFTMLGAGCDSRLKRRGLIHTEFLSIGDHLATLGDEYDITPNEHRPCSSFPNVFHPDFEAYSRYVANQRCVPHRNDPWLFGYFIDNELAWWGRGARPTGLFDAVMKKGAEHTAKRALRDFVAARCGNDVAAFNALWGTKLTSLDGVLTLDALPSTTDAQRDAKLDFLRVIADRYFSVTSRAIREADPNHLVLGARFAGTWGADPAVWEVSGKYCDVVTFNFYPMADLDEGRVYTHFGRNNELTTDHFATYYGYVKKPMLITEWSFPALDAGLPSVHGAGQRFRTQAERTEATRLFARTMLSLPFLLGYDYFMWVDEPALGISTPFPEDSNYGLINEDGVPYPQITAMFEEFHREAGKWRFAPAPEAKTVVRKTPPKPWDVALKASAGQGHPPATFTREGDAFRASNGRLTLAGRIDGGHMADITVDGASVGRYSAMVQTVGADGNPRWTGINKVAGFSRNDSGDGVIQLAFTGEGGGCNDRFEITHHLLLPPGQPWFIAQIVSVKNTGNAPMTVKALYFRLNNDFTSVPQGLPPNLWGVLPSGCWLDRDKGLFLGAVAPDRSSVQIHFWLNPQGGQHPDARLELGDDGITLAPGASFTPDPPVYVFCVAGRGDDQAWLKATEALKRMVE
jgi:hypothetical protein